MSKVASEAIKQFFRTILIAVVPVVIASLQSGVSNWKLVLVTAAIAGLMAIDKAVHVSDSKLNGLVPF